jgi:SAM-dependent methyltransferase
VTDIDTRFLDRLAGPRLAVQRHDIVADPLPEAAFDLVHVRLVLHHLPGREQALRKMVRALKPGGWIVIEEFDWISVVPATATAVPVYSHVQTAVWQLMTARGTDGFYGRQLWGRLRAHGLSDVAVEGRVCMYQGRSPGAELLLAAVEQVRETLLRTGSVTAHEIDAYRDLLADPDFALMSGVLMTAWGQRPAAGI